MHALEIVCVEKYSLLGLFSQKLKSLPKALAALLYLLTFMVDYELVKNGVFSDGDVNGDILSLTFDR